MAANGNPLDLPKAEKLPIREFFTYLWYQKELGIATYEKSKRINQRH